MRITLLPGLMSLALGACYAEVQPQPVVAVNADVAVDTETPDMVEAAPGVQVIADYDEPIFYSDGYYWRSYNGGWYRSTYYTGGWGYWSAPPVAIMHIDRPYAYAHYRPAGYVARHPARAYNRGGGGRGEVRGVRENHAPVREEHHEEHRSAPARIEHKKK